MGSPAELEVHAYFHNYHGKLKFVGSQLLKSRPDLPSCNQGLHSNNLVPEGSDGYVCQWEHCDVSVFKLLISHQMTDRTIIVVVFIFLSLYRVHLTTLSGSTDMWTIMWKVLSHSLSHNNSRLSSATGQVRLSDKRRLKR